MKLIQRLLGAIHVRLYRLTGGRIGSSFSGASVLILTTVGRRSGRRRDTPLMYVMDAGNYVLVASNGGADSSPAWYYNATAAGSAAIQVRAQSMSVLARRATADECERLWPRAVAMYPGYARYQENTLRQIPLVVLEPAMVA